MDDIKQATTDASNEPKKVNETAPPQPEQASKTETSEPGGLSDGDVAVLKHKYSLTEHHLAKPKRRVRQSSPVLLASLGVIAGAVLITLMLWVRHSGPAIEDASAAQTVPAIVQLQAVLDTVEGSAEIDGQTASLEQTLDKSSTLKTAADSRAGITISDQEPFGSVIRLDGNTELDFMKLNNQAIAAELTSEAGGAYVRVIADGNRTVEINLGTDRISISSGLFQVIANGSNQGVRVFEGSLSINAEQTVAAGQQWFSKHESRELVNAATEFNKQDLSNDNFLQWNIELDKKTAAPNLQLGILDDIEPPTITIIQPNNPSSVETEMVTIAGTTEPNAAILVTTDDPQASQLAETTADENGAFTLTIKLKLGVNQLILTATDSAANTATATLSLTRQAAAAENLILEAAAETNGILLNWTTPEGASVSDGYRVVYSSSVDSPAFGESAVQTAVADDEITLLPLRDGLEYSIRVCVYRAADQTCANYSNTVRITAPANAAANN